MKHAGASRRTPLALAAVAALVVSFLAACSLGSGSVPERLDEMPPSPRAGEGVALRQLVLATSSDDVGLAAWKSILDRIGTPYDIVIAGPGAIDRNKLVRPTGVGRYNAVLLASAALYVPAGGGNFRSGLDPSSWAALWDYERAFGVRQVALSASPGTTPEDYCIRAGWEGGVGSQPEIATPTEAGATIFDRLRPNVPIPISDAYVYRTRLQPGCRAQPILTMGPDVVGALSTAPDGRERLGLTMTLPIGRTGADLMGYALLRWATKGVFLGEQRAWFAVDVDDWLLPTEQVHRGGTMFRLTGPEAQSVADRQDALRDRHPLAADFTLNLAYNASTLDVNAPRQCDDQGTPDALSSYTKCLVHRFRWINHTLSHPALNTTSYEVARTQIADNLQRAADAGIPVPKDILKTPEYSGLGFYADTPNGMATDHGLGAANPALLQAAGDLGVHYLHGNMSFPSHRPNCANCTTGLPQRSEIVIVPDWPTAISYEATTPDEATAAYNAIYGVHGSSPTNLGRDLDYQSMIASEADLAFGHITSGSAYVHTLHQGNLHEYAPDRSLAFDWLEAVLTRYDSYFRVAPMNPDWDTLAAYASDRTSHFDGLEAGDDAVWNRATGTLAFSPAVTGTLFVTGLKTDGSGTQTDTEGDLSEAYGSDVISRVRLQAGHAVAFAGEARP